LDLKALREKVANQIMQAKKDIFCHYAMSGTGGGNQSKRNEKGIHVDSVIP
jgi:hypothetical protein